METFVVRHKKITFLYFSNSDQWTSYTTYKALIFDRDKTVQIQNMKKELEIREAKIKRRAIQNLHIFT